METKNIKNKILLSTIEKLHENEKLAKDLCCGLPLDIDQAKRIVNALQADPLRLAAFSSWLEALQETLDETIECILRTHDKLAANGNIMESVIERTHSALESKMNAILRTLHSGKEPNNTSPNLPEATPVNLPSGYDSPYPTQSLRAFQGATTKSQDRKIAGYTEWQP